MEVDFLYIKRVIDNLVTAINQHVEVSDDLLISIIIFYDHDNSIFSLEIQDNDRNFKTPETKQYNYGQYQHHKLNVGRLNSFRMSICNQIITLYGGNFGFELNPIGVKFKFSIPIKSYPIFLIADKEVTMEDSITPKEATLTSISPVETAVIKDVNKVDKKLQALVVDDIKTNRQLLAKLLKNRDLEVDMVENGQKATEYVQDNHDKISIIFMDNMMPVMTGVESTRAIREQGYSGLIIGVTGNTLGEEQITFKDEGADFILGKPVNIPQLEAILAHIKKYGNLSPKSASIESKNEELIQAFEILSSEMERLGHV
jgi:CheY-like chemotaxis protein